MLGANGAERVGRDMMGVHRQITLRIRLSSGAGTGLAGWPLARVLVGVQPMPGWPLLCR